MQYKLSFNNLKSKKDWSAVKFPILSYGAPAVLPNFSINGLDRVVLMIIKEHNNATIMLSITNNA